ncbi:MAG: CysS/YqeB C-terminal domain-containing protein, partial [Longimicrobiales bacterium]
AGPGRLVKWDSPWGEGFPGWHSECSAMSLGELGERIDLHTGGEDNVFPHHEDEIAQSEGASGQPFVRVWLHVKHLLVDGEKMSKSKGNVYTVDDLETQGHTLPAVRLQLLSAHYRSELNFTTAGLDDARAAIRRLVDFRDRVEVADVETGDVVDAGRHPLASAARQGLVRFEAAIADDLDTPAALAALFDFVREANAALDRQRIVPAGARAAALDLVARADRVLGVLELEDQRAAVDPDLADWVEERIRSRAEARARRDFDAADAIREELEEAGVVVEDTPGGARWRRK